MWGSRSSPRSGRRGRDSPHDPPAPGQSADRGQTEPLAALAALLAVGIGLAVFAGAAGQAPAVSDRSLAEPALERTAVTVLADGVVDPKELPDPETVAPDGYEARVTLLFANRERHVGPRPPADADRASRPVTVRVAPGDQRPGRLVVEVWAP